MTTWIIVGIAAIGIVFAMLVVLIYVLSSGKDDGLDRGEGLARQYDIAPQKSSDSKPSDAGPSSLERGNSQDESREASDPEPAWEPKQREPPEVQMERSAPDAFLSPMSALGAISIHQATIGDQVRIAGVPEPQAEIDFRILGTIRYHSDHENWVEHYGSYQNREVAVEVFSEADGEVGVLLNDRMISIDDLQLTEEDLVRWDEGDGQGQTFQFDGRRWKFVSSGEVTYSEGGSDDQGGYYGWDFADESGQQMLCVEKREGEPFEICLLYLLSADRARVSRN